MTVDRFMGPTFLKIFYEIWTDFLGFGNVGGVTPPPPLMCAPVMLTLLFWECIET